MGLLTEDECDCLPTIIEDFCLRDTSMIILIQTMISVFYRDFS